MIMLSLSTFCNWKICHYKRINTSMKYVEMYENSRSLAIGHVGHRGISTDNTTVTMTSLIVIVLTFVGKSL